MGLPGGFRGWPIQWNHAKCCGPTLVAMATKFGLGTEIQSPTGLFVVFLYWILATEHGLFFCVLFQCFTAVHWMTGNSKFVLSSVSSVISKLPMAVSVHAKAVILLIKSSPVVYVLTY